VGFCWSEVLLPALNPHRFNIFDGGLPGCREAVKRMSCVLYIRVPHFATRATLLSTEILKSKGMYAEAAAQLIKMTSEVSQAYQHHQMITGLID